VVVHLWIAAGCLHGGAPFGTLRIELPKKPAIDLLERLPDNFCIEDAVWIGDLVVLFPTDLTVCATTSRRPLVWNGKTLAPAKSLPDAAEPKGKLGDPPPSFLRRGQARTGAGVDVLIWEGAGWIAKNDRFVKTWNLDPDPSVWLSGPVIGVAGSRRQLFLSAPPSQEKDRGASPNREWEMQRARTLRRDHR
jgi:hypothetical protein